MVRVRVGGWGEIEGERDDAERENIVRGVFLGF